MNLLPTASLLFTATVLAVPATAQIDRETSTLVAYQHLRHASLAEIQTWTAQGYRLSNFEISQPSPLELNCSLVRNTGVYQASWVLYTDKTRAELAALVTNNNRRIVDLERAVVNGEERLTALAFTNSGQQQKGWFWHTGIPQGSIWTTVAGMGNRVIDLEPYTVDGEIFYHVISIANSGPDYKPWWVYSDATVSDIQAAMTQHDARLYDYEVESLLPSRVCAVMVRDAIPSLTLWGQYYGPSFDLDVQNGGRVVMAHTQGLGSTVITMVDNFDPFTESGFASMGTNGLTTHTGEGTGFTGSTLTYRAQNLRPWAPAWAVYGLVPQALNLLPLGAPGCWAWVQPLATELRFANGSGIATDTIPIPPGPTFQGLPLVSQMIALDPGINQLGIQTSNRLTTLVRHW